MPKETYYFSHDYNARSDMKLSALTDDFGPAGYGVYWCIIEILHEEETHKLPALTYVYKSIAKQMSTSAEQVLNIVQGCINDYDLFKQEGGYFYSERVLNNIGKRDELKEKRRAAGRKSAEKRLKKEASAEQVLNTSSTSVEQNSTKEIKGKERKEKESKESIKTNAPTYSLPPGINLGKLQGKRKEAFDNWIKYLTETQKRRLSAQQINIIIETMTAYKDEDVKNCVNRSIENNYKSLVWEKYNKIVSLADIMPKQYKKL